MARAKLTIPQQIQHMKDKGIKFTIMSEEDAERYLKYNNYYFRLKAYAKNYGKFIDPKDKVEKYFGLEFAYLKELAILDMRLRSLILSMALDIEHYMKNQMIFDITRDPYEDGATILKEVFGELDTIEKDKGTTNACRDLINKYSGEWAVWNFVEILSFKNTIKLYEYFYSKHDEYKCEVLGLLFSVRFLRNAAAHNNCLINSIKNSYTAECKSVINLDLFNQLCNSGFVQHKLKGVSNDESAENYTVTSKRLNEWMNNHVINDFISLLVVYKKCVTSGDLKKHRFAELQGFFNGRMVANSHYFKSNRTLQNAYKITKKFIDFIAANDI